MRKPKAKRPIWKILVFCCCFVFIIIIIGPSTYCLLFSDIKKLCIEVSIHNKWGWPLWAHWIGEACSNLCTLLFTVCFLACRNTESRQGFGSSASTWKAEYYFREHISTHILHFHWQLLLHLSQITKDGNFRELLYLSSCGNNDGEKVKEL